MSFVKSKVLKGLYPCAAVAILFGCASAPKGAWMGVTTCPSDPQAGALLCKNEYGEYDVPFKDSQGFMCTPYDEFKRLLLEAAKK